MGQLFGGVDCLSWTVKLPNAVSYLFYLAIPILSTGLSIWLSQYLGKDEFKEGEVASIEHANNSFLPSYLGYFFVALSIGTGKPCGLCMGCCSYSPFFRRHSALIHCFCCLVMSFTTSQLKTAQLFSN